MLKRLAGIASRVLFFGATVLDSLSAPETEFSPPPDEDDLEPDALSHDGVLTDAARAMVAPRIPRPPKVPLEAEPLTGSLEWRSRQRTGTGGV